MKFTEGPWEVLNNYVKKVGGAVIATTARNNAVCRFEAEVASLEDEANANLIAASPELLAALENLLDMVTDMRTHGPEVEAAADVIYKARGE